MKSRWMIAGGAVGLFFLLGLGTVAWTWSALDASVSDDESTRVFEVPPGEGMHAVARRLDEEGYLPSRGFFGPRVFVNLARIAGLELEVKAGEYDLSRSMTPRQILDQIVRGAVKTYPVTLPEGWRLDEVALQLEKAEIVAAHLFLEVARDPDFARESGLEADTFEGYLYPETYRFRRNTDAREVVTRMHQEFLRRVTPEDRARIEADALSLHELVTLASIIEKETAVDAERGLVAAVYRNRLRIGMRLQADPTVIYGILHTRGEWDGNIRWRDLRTDTVYNTYTRAGLPPGPISSTTVESIRAALAPDDVPYLYFVSRNDGTHVFSKTLAEHNRAVNRFQKRGRAG